MSSAIHHEASSQAWDPSLFETPWERRTGQDRLVLMVKDPWTLFVYWEASDTLRRLTSWHFRCPWERLPLFLQWYDVSDVWFDGTNAHRTERIAVHPDGDNWYIHGVEPGRHYLVDFGTITLTGAFFTLLRSNVVQTPPCTVQAAAPMARFAPLHRFSTSTLDTGGQDAAHLAAVARVPDVFDGYSVPATAAPGEPAHPGGRSA